MSALLITPCLEVSCRNDAVAGVGDRVAVLEWTDPHRETEGRATALLVRPPATCFGSPGRTAWWRYG